MIDRKTRSTNRNKLIALAAVAVAVIALLAWGRGCRADPLPAPLEGLLARLEAPGTPQWKRDLVPRIRERRIGRFEARVTYYSPGNAVDPLGGGLWSAWGLRLRKGHAAVGTSVRAVPYGTVLYAPGALDHLLVVTDCGPGVQGRDRLDICIPDTDEYLALDCRNWRRYPAWILGHATKEQAQ